MPKVLMVTPYWPPVNKVGVWRVMRTARYLSEFGWIPLICTPHPEDVYPQPPFIDESLLAPPAEVLQPRVHVPSMMAARVSGAPRRLLTQLRAPAQLTQVGELIERGSFKLIAEMLLPDQFVEWGLGVTRHLNPDLDVDAVWVTGGPFGMHIAGTLIAERLKKPLMLDYRDPWTSHRPPRRGWISAPQRLLRLLEEYCLKKAKSVSYIHRESLLANRALFGTPEGALWRVITNSFDPIDLGDLPPMRPEGSQGKPALVYAGNFYDARSALGLLKALEELQRVDPDEDHPVTAHIYGQLDPPAQAFLKDHPIASSRLLLHPRCGAEEIGAIMRGADASLLVIGDDPSHQTALSGKIWDYLAAGTPIIGLGPFNASARALIEAEGVGIWVNSADTQSLVEALKRLSRGGLPQPSSSNASRYHARQMSRAMAELLDHLIS